MRHSLLFIINLLICFAISAKAPDLMLLESYKKQNVEDWVMSEKLDGVRGYWNGSELYTRNGVKLTPPDYFIAHFPPFAIDGELFIQRNAFAKISGIVRAKQDKGWQHIKLYVFDVPEAESNLFQRLAQLEQYLAQHPTPYIQIIEQIPIKNHQHIQQFLQQVEQQQGEGIVLRNPNAPYERKRSSQILKLKTTLDEECKVIAHHKGKGQFADYFGSLTCENHRGRFKIGSGFNFADRLNPPPINSIITYKYRGLTKTGKPRFATYWRKKEQIDMEKTVE